MRRFDRDQELDRLIARDDVRHEELHRLGADLAGWEAAAPVAAPDTPWGSPDGALSAVLESFGALREPAAPFAHARLAQLESQLRDAHRRLERWFETRRATGRIRECHGDLHCRNVVRIDGRLTPFDAIDFSASLRWIDVASDAAFLAMDLLQFGRPDLAYAFLDGWFDASGDHDAARGLPWYLAYRALVRAKVDGLRARQLGPGADADAAWREADRFLALAEARLRPAPGRLYVTTGPSGSGKSWLAERLVPVLPAIRLRSDVERKRLAGLAPLDRRGAGLGSALYAPEASARTYDALANAARELLAAGFDVLVDAANLQAAQRDLFRRVAREAGTTLAWLDCTAAPATLRARLDARQGDASDATTAVLEMQLATREPLDEREVAAAVRVDTGVRVDAAAVARALRAAAAPPDGSTPASAPAS
jgi:predicted kinase